MGHSTGWIGTLISCYGKLYIHQLFLGADVKDSQCFFFWDLESETWNFYPFDGGYGNGISSVNGQFRLGQSSKKTGGFPSKHWLPEGVLYQFVFWSVCLMEPSLGSIYDLHMS